MGTFASKAAGWNEGIFGRFFTGSLILDKSAFGLTGNAEWDLDVESLAAVHTAGDVLKLVDFVFGQLGCRKNDGEFRAFDRA